MLPWNKANAALRAGEPVRGGFGRIEMLNNIITVEQIMALGPCYT
jgi:hypothetical protein